MRFAPFLVALWCCGAVAAQAASLEVHPARVTLDSAVDAHRIVVIATDAQGLTREVTSDVRFAFGTPGIATVEDGVLRPLRDGETQLSVRHGDLAAHSAVLVRGAAVTPPVSFRHDVLPVLTRAGCNAGACHGAASGKNGFGLSLFGYGPRQDYLALTRESRGRRLDCADPDASLMLVKPSNEVRHKGGKRLEPRDPMWTTLRDWIAEGAIDDGDDGSALVGLTIEPRTLTLGGPGQRSRIVVSAEYADGTIRDVTDLALLSSSSTTTVTIDAGVVESGARGEAFVLARFGFCAEVAPIVVLPDAEPWDAPAMVAHNEIDELVQARLRRLRLAPAPPCDDATFVRRVFVDVIGKLPTPDEVRTFVADEDPSKRSRLVDALLERPEFPDVWAAAWADVLRIESDQLEPKGVHLYTRWLREAFGEPVPIDAIIRRLLVASGSAFEVPEANYWVVARDPKVLAENAAQTFLGIRVQCAQCHNHPFERWTMDDYYGFAAFFGQVGRKRGSDPRETIVFDQGRGGVTHPRTGRASVPQFLGGARPEIPPGTDRREVLAAWMTAADNPWFASNVANRVWARFFGRGLVEPVDDVRVSNPPSHPELHRRLGEKLAASGFDLRALVGEICASATYQAAQHPDDPPVRTHAGALPRRMSAEQILDAICAVTEVPTRLRGLPLGASAVRIADADTGNRFLELFGRPARDSACACERRDEPTFNQVLHLINGETIEAKVRDPNGRLARLLAAGTEPNAILDELFLAAYARLPRESERERLLAEITAAGDDVVPAWEDTLWAILNSKEFLFQH